jgi:hypothetical protein
MDVLVNSEGKGQVYNPRAESSTSNRWFLAEHGIAILALTHVLPHQNWPCHESKTTHLTEGLSGHVPQR